MEGPGTLIEAMVALGGEARTATVTAQTSAELIEIDGAAFQQDVEANPELADELVRLAVRRAEETELAEPLASHLGSPTTRHVASRITDQGGRIAASALATFGERDIEDMWPGFFAMSTDLTTSRPFIHDHGSVVLAIRTTSAIPGLMPSVSHGEALLIDGGILNSLPLDVARFRAPVGG